MTKNKKNLIIELIKGFVKLLKYWWASLIFVILLTTATAYFFTSIWGYIFAIILSYLLADIFSLLIIKGGKGIVIIPLIDDNLTQSKGHGFIFYLIAIFFTTIIGGLLADYLSNLIVELKFIWFLLIANLLLVCLVYFDFNLTYYSRSKK